MSSWNKSEQTLCEVLECLDAWDPQVRVLGNVRAADARNAIRDLMVRLEVADHSDRVQARYICQLEPDGCSDFHTRRCPCTCHWVKHATPGDVLDRLRPR